MNFLGKVGAGSVLLLMIVAGIFGWGYYRHLSKQNMTIPYTDVVPRAVHTNMTNEQKAATYTTMRQQYETIQRTANQRRAASVRAHVAGGQDAAQSARAIAQLCYEQVAVYNRNSALLPPDLLTQPLPLVWGLAEAIPLPVRIDPDDTCRI